MTARSLSTAALATAAIALGGWGAWAWLRPGPSLEPALHLADAGRPDAAERATLDYLRAYPDDATGLILLARVEVERLDRLDAPDPALARDALARVRRARTDDTRLAALGRRYEGDLCERLMHLDEAETAWREAYRLNPAYPEPARRLIQLYTQQGRKQAARELALRLYQAGRDSRERLRSLLELTRIEIYQPAAVEVINKLTPVVRENPNDLGSTLALGRALVREGRTEEGLKHFFQSLRTHPDDPDAADAMLTALEDAGRVESLENELARLGAKPDPLGRLARHRGWVEQERGRWNDAARFYRLATESAPDDPKLRYRLGRMLRLAGDEAEARRLERATRDREAASRALRTLFDRKRAELSDGPPNPDLYQEIADLRERMGRVDEARSWHALALKARPGDARSQAALERLKERDS